MTKNDEKNLGADAAAVVNTEPVASDQLSHAEVLSRHAASLRKDIEKPYFDSAFRESESRFVDALVAGAGALVENAHLRAELADAAAHVSETLSALKAMRGE